MREKFDQNKVNLLQRYLQQQHEKNAPRYFEIYVDNLKVVNRTNDVNEFETYHEFITPDTKLLKILIYSTSATSPRNEPHYYYFADENPVQPTVPTLSGIEIDQRLSEKITAERQRWEAEQQKKEFSDTCKKLTEAEDYIDILEKQLSGAREELESCKHKKVLTTEKTLGNIGTLIVEAVINKYGGPAGLSGLLGQDNVPVENTPVSEVSFSKKTDAVKPEHEAYIKLLQQLETCFAQEDLNKVMKILGALIEQPHNLPTVADLLGIK